MNKNIPVLKQSACAILLSAFSLFTTPALLRAQAERPYVSGWNTYLPYADVVDFVSDDNDMFYCISKASFFTYKHSEDILERYSKANGMSDVEMAFVAADDYTGKVALIYRNGNIDLFKDGKFENIPDLKVSTVPGDKTLYAAHSRNGKLYISSGIGLIIVDLDKKVVAQQVPFYSNNTQALVKSVTTKDNNIYVATDIGLFTTTLNNPQLFNYSTWFQVSPLNFSFLSSNDQHVFAATENQVFQVAANNDLLSINNTTNPIQRLDGSSDGNVWILTKEESLAPYAVKVSSNGTVVDSLPSFFAVRFMDEGDGNYWSADVYSGLRRRSSANPNATWGNIAPAGPSSAGAHKVWAKNGEIWLAHGSKDYTSWLPGLNREVFSRYKNTSWRNWKWDVLAQLPADQQYYRTDAIAIQKDEASGNVYAGLLNGGLIKIDANDQLTFYRNNYLGQNIQNDTNSYRVTDLKLDNENNLWITQSAVQNALRVKTYDDKWYNFNINGIKHLAAIAIDDLGQKWMAAGENGDGIAVFNDNNTIDNPNDDYVRKLSAGETSGNLPNVKVHTIAKDKNGEMWVGTESGIAIFSCGADIRQGICNAILRPLVTKGFNFANHMFEGIPVKSIAVDGGNRKWVGTSVGVFLLSEDGEEIVEQFTEENSPLLSNTIINIDIDPVTGVVYISTAKGLCSFGGTAIEADATISKPLFVFPNPVPSGYNGQISIKGMTEVSNVKITDINGQLVFQGTSNGAMFAWDGRDYNGRKVQSGVYLVFVVSKDGTQKANGKFIIHE
ncbi:MAG: T9SS type A sorting domain-containing protein [Sphingobacteriales bacterium]|nr:MAG: T9SS type A sorting domain-containing protein [Sphingobacteriales bacterium]